MKFLIKLSFFLGFLTIIWLWLDYMVFAEDGIDICSKLNTNIPYLCDGNGGGDKVKPGEAFSVLIWWMSKLLVAFIMVFSFLLLVAWGILITMSGADQSLYAKGKSLIIKVVVGIILLGLAGLILHLINPNFFKL